MPTPIAIVLSLALALMVGAIVMGYLYERKMRKAAEAARQAADVTHARSLVSQASTASDALQAVRQAEAERDFIKQQRDFAMDQHAEARRAITEMQRQLDNYGRAKGRLYSEAIEDVQSHNVAAAQLLLNSKRDLEDAMRLLTGKGGNTDKR